MRRRHDRDTLLHAAVLVCLAEGLGGLSFGAVARRAQVPDRTVVYYFPNKGELVGAVIERLAQQLMTRLEGALGEQRLPAADLLARLWPALTAPDAGPVVRVWLELCVRASTGEQPYLHAAQQLATAWLAWLAEHLDAPTPPARRAAAAVMLARVDGALLLHHIGLHDAADQALGGERQNPRSAGATGS